MARLGYIGTDSKIFHINENPDNSVLRKKKKEEEPALVKVAETVKPTTQTFNSESSKIQTFTQPTAKAKESKKENKSDKKKTSLKDALNNYKETIKNSAVNNQGFNISNAISDLANLSGANKQLLESVPIIGNYYKTQNQGRKNAANLATNMATGAVGTMEKVADAASDLVFNPIEQRYNYAFDYLTKGKKTADENLADLKKMQERDIKKNRTEKFLEDTGYNDVADELEEGSAIKRNNFLGQVFQGTGGMVPALVLGQAWGGTPELTNISGLKGKEKLAAALGNVGKTYMAQLPSNAILGASSYGSGMEEALNDGASMNRARAYGLTNAGIEQLTEMLTGGVPGLEGKGGIDQFVEPLINRNTNGYLNALLRAGYGALGEGLEESAGTYLDALARLGILGQDINWNEVNREALQSGLTGAATGAILNSPSTSQDFQNVKTENKIRNALGDAEYAEGREQYNPDYKGWENQREENRIKNEKRVEENTKRKEEFEKIQQQRQEEARKAQELAQESQKEQERIRQQEEINQALETRKTQNTEQSDYDKYYKKNNLKDYDSTITEKAKETIASNKQGKRTKQEWLDVAKNIGMQSKGMDAEALKKYAYESFKSERPNIKENLNRQGQKYVSFKVDEWVNAVQKAAQSQSSPEAVQSSVETEQQTPQANNKQMQFDIISNNNPMQDEYHTGIRSEDDIKTFEEAINDEESFVWGDYSKEDAQRDLEKGTVTVYSSKPIEQGAFVSTSQNQARDYAGGNKIYSQEVPIEDVAWINGDEGQYAKVENNNIPAEMEKEPVIVAENEKKVQEAKTKENAPKKKQDVDMQENVEQDKEVSKIMDKIPEERKPKITEKLKNYVYKIRHKFTDHKAAIYDMSREYNNPTLYHKSDAIDSADSWAQNMIDKRQTDINGKAYKNFTDEQGNTVSMGYKKAYELYKSIPDNDKASFLVHMRNIDQMKNGIDQFEIPLETSEKVVAELRKKNKNIDKWGENIWTYGHNQLQNMVDAGFRSQKVANQYLENNPHYVRIQRNVDNSSAALETKGKNAKIKNPVQKIKGSTLEIMPLKETQAKYTQEVMKAIKLNEFGQEYAKTVGVSSDGKELTNIEDMFGVDEKVLNGEDGNYTFTIFDKGRPITLPINEGIYESLKSRKITEVPILSDLTSVQRELLTNKNIYFAGTNAIKDFNDMMLYSKYPIYKSVGTYAELFGGRTFGKGINAIQNKTNGTNNINRTQQWVELYENRGNLANSIFNKGQFKKESGKVGKVVKFVPNSIEKANNFIESMPRITEFVNTIRENGYDLNSEGELVTKKERFIEQNKDKMSEAELQKKASKIKEPTKSLDKVLSEADYNAAEITTNFKRGGEFAKTVDKNGVTFFNASVQGASKFGRTFTEAFGDARNGDFRAAKRLFARAMALGLAPALLGKIMYKDDKEYEELPDYVKDQYYVYKMNKVPGLGQTLWKNKAEDQFVRIPKGRAVSIFNSGAKRTINKATGDKDAFKGYDSLIINQIAPNNPLDNNLLAPIAGVASEKGKSWSGNQIVSDYLSEQNPYMQYDAKTSEFSKWVGRKLRNTELKDVAFIGPYLEAIRSPKKLDYLIDQYSGVIGDLVLPSMTNYAESEKDSGFSALSNPFKSKFTTNSTLNNKTVSDYYTLKSKVLADSGDHDATNLKKAKNEYMNGEYSEIKSHLSSLYAEQREIQNSKELSDSEKYQQNKAKQREIVEYMKKVMKDIEGAKEENGVVTIGDKTYVPGVTSYGNKKMKEMSANKMDAINNSGLSIGEYTKVDNYISGLEADKDSSGKSIQGSVKKKAISYLREQGYSDSTIKSIVEGYGWKFKEGD